jgi:hypothetical protein
MHQNNEPAEPPCIQDVVDAPRADVLSRRQAMNMLTKIAALPSVVAAAFIEAPAMAHAHKDEHEDRLYTSGYDDGQAGSMEAFAIAWLSEWTSKGGSVTMALDDPERAWIGQPTYRFSPVCKADEHLRDQVREQDWFKSLSQKDQVRIEQDNYRFNSTFFNGKMRALSELLNAVPGGAEAVKRIVSVCPAAGMHPLGTQEGA